MVQFSKSAAERIAAATKQVEKSVMGTVPPKRRSIPSHSDGFWARITQHEFDDNVKYRYSWQKVRINADDELENMGQEWGGGAYSADSGYAIEVNRSQWVIVGDLVWMQIQHDPFCYCFQYSPGVRIGRTREIIAAREEGEIFSGRVELWKYHRDHDTETIVEAGNTDDTEYWHIDAYNSMEVEVGQWKNVQLTYSTHDGIWWITAEQCS